MINFSLLSEKGRKYVWKYLFYYYSKFLQYSLEQSGWVAVGIPSRYVTFTPVKGAGPVIRLSKM